MVVFRGRLGYVADSEFGFHLAKPGVWVVRPEVGDLECHVGHLLVSLFFFRRLLYLHKEVWPRS